MIAVPGKCAFGDAEEGRCGELQDDEHHNGQDRSRRESERSAGTLGNATSEDSACRMWILEPAKVYWLEGFYSQASSTFLKCWTTTNRPRDCPTGVEADRRAGYIDVSVFRENPNGEEMKVNRTLRSATSHSRDIKHPATAIEARERVSKRAIASSTPQKKLRGLIVENEAGEERIIEKDELKNPAQVYQMHIGYYKPITTPLETR